MKKAHVFDRSLSLVPTLEPRRYSLSPVQQGMLFHSLYDQESPMYFVQDVWELRERLQRRLFEDAWQIIVTRHDVLRTSIELREKEEALQIVHENVDCCVRYQDLSDRTQAVQETIFESFLKEDRKVGFDLQQPPLLRLALFKLGDAHYKFVLSHHHLIFDGRSELILIREFWEVYSAYVQGLNFELKAPDQYLHYIAWLQEQDFQRAESFWRATLLGVRGATRVPNTAAYLQGHAVTQQYEARSLSEEVTKELARCIRDMPVTFNTVLQGVWALMLAQYSGESTVVFGAPRAARHWGNEEHKAMVGVFTNTLPVACQVSPSRTVADILKGLRDYWVNVRQYEHTPLSLIRGWCDLPSKAALFESLVLFENYERNELLRKQGGEWLNRRFSLIKETNYPITLFGEAGTRLRLTIRFDRRRYDEASVRQLLEHLETMLASIARAPNQTVAELRRRLTRKSQHSQGSAEAGPSVEENSFVHRLFEREVERHPDAIAVRFKEEHVTYRWLNRRADALACKLNRLGVGIEGRVGLFLERSAQVPIAILGSLKAGSAFLPCDTSEPLKRVCKLFATANVSVVITERNFVDTFESVGFETLTLDQHALERGANERRRPGEVSPKNLAYILYTSGSTGQPKAVCVTHEAIANYVSSVSKHLDLGECRDFALVSTIGADLGNTVLFSALCLGACLHILPQEQTLDPDGLGLYLESNNIDVLKIVPSHLAALVSGSSAPQNLIPRTKLILGGEPLGGDLATRIRELAPHCTIVNHYGPTEATVGVSTYSMTGSEPSSRTLPLGKPLANTTIEVLDTAFLPVPSGVPGEIVIGGICLARGYLNDPLLTASRFVPDPFSAVDGARMFVTGDRACVNPEANLEFLGRQDDQVKIRGYRVELGEIESTIVRHRGVRDAAVVLQNDHRGMRLAAFVVGLKGNPTRALSRLRSFLLSELPVHMVPDSIHFLDSLPLTPNGKVDRKKLYVLAPASDGESKVTGGDGCEQTIAAIWSQVLGVSTVGVNDNFFELGGHSLLAMQLTAKLRAAFQVDISLRTVFDSPTVASMGAAIRDARDARSPGIPALEPASRDTPPPLSFAQSRTWFLDVLGMKSAYNVPIAQHIEGELELAALEASLNHIVTRHEILRTVYPTVKGQPQASIKETRIPIVVRNVDGNPETRPAIIDALLCEELSLPFDLSTGPVLRAVLFRENSRSHVLLVTIHHIAFDARSREIFLEELWQHYKEKEDESRKDALDYQYRDYAVWQHKLLMSPRLREERAYWMETLAGASPLLDLGVYKTRPTSLGTSGDSVGLVISSTLTRLLRGLSQTEGVTLFMTLFSTFAVLVSTYAETDDVVIGTPIAGRSLPELDALIGNFVNTIVLRVDLSGDLTFVELLDRVRRTALSAYLNQDFPFEKLVEELRPVREPNYNPLVQVMFNFHKAEPPALASKDLRIRPRAVGTRTAKFDMNITLLERDDDLEISLEYSRELLDEETAKAMLLQYKLLLERFIEQPSTLCKSVALLDEEGRRLINELGTGPSTRQSRQGICATFEAQAERTPDRIALVQGNSYVSFGALNKWANQVGWYLRSLGVDSEQVVGVLMTRSVDAVVALMGILKAGGAYLPLDPEHPRERVAFMVKDAGASLILTDQEDCFLSGGSIRVIRFSETAGMDRDRNLQLSADSESAVYVMYTSGTTGEPKGIIGLHAATMNRFEWMWSRFPFAAGDVCCQKTALGFVDSVWEVFAPLLKGVPLVICPEETVRDPTEFVKLLARHRVTRVTVVPTLIKSLLETGAMLNDISHLRHCFSSGEVLTKETARRFRERVGNCALVNLFGCTEAAGDSTAYEVPRAPIRSDVPIGKPIANTRIRILDSVGNSVPAGVPGEIFVSGAGLARGYAGKPALTADRFVPEPDADGARMYATGDIGRFDAEGQIHYLGRRDEQVKIRGGRVELSEVASILSRHPVVRDAVVQSVKDSDGTRLAAYLVAGAGTLPSDGELRRYAGRRLLDYMLPSEFVWVERFPLTRSGKIDHAALSRAKSARVASRKEREPRDEIERRLVSIWQNVLGTDSVGVQDDFFELGGHSLLAATLVSKIQREFGKRIPLGLLLKAPTIEELRVLLGRLDLERGTRGLVALNSKGTKIPIFLVPPAGATSLGFVGLARHLGPDQPLYSFEPLGLTEGVPHERIEDMVAYYLRSLLAERTNGPYLLGGMCFGGHVALEMANRLTDMGERVDGLIVVDSGLPVTGPTWTTWEAEEGVGGMWRRAGTRSVAKSVRDYVHYHLHFLPRRFTPQGRAFMRVFTAHLRARRTVKARPFEGRMLLVQSEEYAAFASGELARRWGELAGGGVDHVVISGARHMDIVRTEATMRVVAEELRKRL